MGYTHILRFIEDNNLVRIDSIDEVLFSRGKLQLGFFIYLVIEMEEFYGITFSDEELKIEKFDTIRMIESMIERKINDNQDSFGS